MILSRETDLGGIRAKPGRLKTVSVEFTDFYRAGNHSARAGLIRKDQA